MAQLKDLIVNGPSRFIGPAYGLIKAFSANGATISIMIGGESASTTVSIDASAHYVPNSATASKTLGSTAAGNFLNTISLDSKNHVTGFTSGSETTLTTCASTATNTAAAAITAITVSGHKIGAALTNKIFSASTSDSARTLVNTFKVSSAVTADSARTVISTFKVASASTADSARTATQLAAPLRIYNNGTLIATYSGGTVSALTTDSKVSAVGNHYTASTATQTGGTTTGTDASAIKGITYDAAGHIVGITTGSVLTGHLSVTAGTVGTGVVTGLTASGTANHAIVGLKTDAVQVNSAKTASAVTILTITSPDNSFRGIWWSHGTYKGMPVSEDAFQYNPATNQLKVSAITMNGTNAIQVPNKAGTFALTSDLTGNTDTATTETGHYTPSTTASTLGSDGAGNFIKTITLDSKKHVLSITSGTAITAQTQLSYSSGSSVSNAASSVMTGLTVSNHAITYGKTNKIFSASTADIAVMSSGVVRTLGETDVYRDIWFSHATKPNHMSYDDDFQYNPATNLLKVSGFTNGTTRIVLPASSGTVALEEDIERLDFMLATAANDLNERKLDKADFSDSATTYDGHYAPTGTSTTSGARITGITVDGKGHVTNVATASTDNVDEKVKASTATTKAYILGHAATASTATAITHANTYISDGAVYSEGKIVLTGVTAAAFGSGVVTGVTVSGTSSNKGINLTKTTAVKVDSASTADSAKTVISTFKVSSASTADSARTVISTFKVASASTADSARTALQLTQALRIYQNGSLIATYSGGTVSALTTDSDQKVYQSTSTTASYRSLLLGTTTGSTVTTATAATTGQAYVTTNVVVQPSTGKIFAKGFAISAGTTNDNFLTADGGSVAQSNFVTTGNVTNYETAWSPTINGDEGVLVSVTAGGTKGHSPTFVKTKAVIVNSASTLSFTTAGTSATNSYRNVWFSYDGDNSKVVQDADFQYNPRINSLKVSALTTNGTNQVLVPAKDGTIALTEDIDDVEFVFATAVNDLNTNKQDKLINGQNIKTIGGQSILGTGDIVVSSEDNKVKTSWQGTGNGVAYVLAQMSSLSGTASEAVISPKVYFNTNGLLFYNSYEVVSEGTSQTISGIKNFSAGLTVPHITSPSAGYRNIPVSTTAVTNNNIRYMQSAVTIDINNARLGVKGFSPDRGTNVLSLPTGKTGTLATLDDIPGDTATTLDGHYTPTGTTTASGARITGITRDAKGHVTSVATAATDNTDTKVANAASNAKGFLLAHTAQTKTATSITNASVWMSGGTLYSNAKKVSNLIVCSLTQTQYDSLSSYDPDMIFAISGETPTNSDEKVKTATATTKAYLVGKAATTGTTTGITHGSVYMSGGVLYSNGSAVLTAQTSVSITNSGDGVVTGGTTGGTAGHSITLNKTTAVKVNSATTADVALNVMMTTGVAATSASITLDTTAARTYTIYSGTTASITLDATVQNPGYEHYALFKNTGSGNMVITPKTGWVTTDSTFTVASGKYMELSYICAGSQLIITGSKVMITK